MTTLPYASELESVLQRLFIQYKPRQVMTAWNNVLADFRDALNEVEDKPKQTIVLKNTIEQPVLPTKQDSDKEAQKDKAKTHREVIQKKRQELAQKGIIPETQLTEENLKKWIQQEKKNYWVIAEETGCYDSDVSVKAKSLNILSDIALMIRKKKASIL